MPVLRLCSVTGHFPFYLTNLHKKAVFNSRTCADILKNACSFLWNSRSTGMDFLTVYKICPCAFCWIIFSSSLFRIYRMTEPVNCLLTSLLCHNANNNQYKLSLSSLLLQMHTKQFGQGSLMGFPVFSPRFRIKKELLSFFIPGR